MPDKPNFTDTDIEIIKFCLEYVNRQIPTEKALNNTIPNNCIWNERAKLISNLWEKLSDEYMW